jgi:hypothetical protein
MQSGLSPFLVNIIPLQNIQSNTTGLDATTQLSNTVDGLVQMVNFEQKRIYTDNISAYTTGGSIQVLSPMNLNGVNITGGGSVLVNGDGTTINTTTGTFSTLLVDASGTFGGIVYAAGFVTLSDQMEKKNIEPLARNRLEVLEGIQGYTFEYAGGEEKQIGFMAQELVSTFPELVAKGEKGMYVKYDGMIPVLLEAIHDLRERVRMLECAKKA